MYFAFSHYKIHLPRSYFPQSMCSFWGYKWVFAKEQMNASLFDSLLSTFRNRIRREFSRMFIRIFLHSKISSNTINTFQLQQVKNFVFVANSLFQLTTFSLALWIAFIWNELMMVFVLWMTGWLTEWTIKWTWGGKVELSEWIFTFFILKFMIFLPISFLETTHNNQSLSRILLVHNIYVCLNENWIEKIIKIIILV